MIDFESERRMLAAAMAIGEEAAEAQGLALHSIAIGLPGDPPGRVRFSLRDPDSPDYYDPIRPGWKLASQVRRYLRAA